MNSEALKVDDLEKISDIHDRILSLIHTTNLPEHVIEDMLLPVERILEQNGINLKEYDV